MTYGNKECSFSEYMKELRDTDEIAGFIRQRFP